MLEIDNRIISRETPPYIIAELSANHNGSITRAKESIKEAKKNNSYLGVVRYEQIPSNKSIYEISINISPEQRGKGIGRLVLQKSINCFLKDESCCNLIKAKVKKENIPSIKTFLKCGFEFFEENNEIITLIIKRN